MLDATERAEMLEGLGLGEGGLPTFLHAAYELLGLRTFFTTGLPSWQVRQKALAFVIPAAVFTRMPTEGSYA